jgi:hypothetical protein
MPRACPRSADTHGVVPPAATVQEVWRVASGIEPDQAAMLAWYRDQPIAELDGLPAAALVACGRADAVVAFLRAVRDGHRG